VVKNTGNTQIANVTLVDANGAATDIDVALLTPTYSGGNTDAILEPGEIWTFTSGSSNLTTTVDGIVTLDGIEQIWEDTDDDPATPDVLVDYQIDEVTDHVVVTVINPSMTISTTSNHSSSASPLAAKIYSGGTVTYTYTVANTGSTNLESVIVVADNCPTPAYVSGDANSDHKMQPSETWIFTCTTTAVNATQSSQNVKAKAVDADLLTSVTTNTQQVGITVYVPASLTLTKTATNATNSASGSNIQVGVTNAVTYNYSLDNSGSTNVSVPVVGGQPNRDSAVVDDKCSPVTYVSGDTNTDGVLDTSETWEFTCVVSGSISQTTIGNATASLIDPLGNPAQSNTATNTVTVLAPSLLVKIEAANEYVKYGNSMTYTYTVENNGGTNIASFSPSDSNCAPLVGPTKSAATGYTSNNDGVLNVGEIWTYTCTKANITSDAMSNFTLGTVTDSLNYSGYVPAPAVTQVFVVDPSLSVVQKASIYDNGNLVVGPALDVPANIGDTVKYTYEISSGAATRGSSIAGLNNMLVNSITDAQCAPITIVDANADGLNDGDINLDGVLDPAETWAYTCSTTQVTQTAQVVDAQAEVTAASVVENLTLRPASVRVRVAGAAATASPSPGVTQTATPTASPSPSASPSASPIAPKPSVSPSPVAASGKLVQRVYFTGDSAKLTSTAQKQLAALAKKAKSLGAKFSVAVIGRVKETADKSYDLRLSKQRATNVADRLRKLGLYGTYRTVAAGISPENQPISRRVEVTITWKK
jgi:outer membrane protein OmpA-like peptidoglycan-associated protein